MGVREKDLYAGAVVQTLQPITIGVEAVLKGFPFADLIWSLALHLIKLACRRFRSKGPKSVIYLG
jgi:hypothetical protein